MGNDCHSLVQPPSTTEKDNLVSMLQKKQIQREDQNYELPCGHPTREKSWPLWPNIEDKNSHPSLPGGIPLISFHSQVYTIDFY